MIEFDASLTHADIPILLAAPSATGAAMTPREKLEVIYWAKVALGAPYTIQGVDETFQIREQDKANWLTFRGVCMEMRLASLGDDPAPLKMRASSNVSYEVTANEGWDATGAIRTYASALLSRYWDLKDAIAAGEAPDVTTGWP